MSAFESMYAECLWYCACAIDRPISARRAAHSSIGAVGVVLAIGARRERVVDVERQRLDALGLRRIDVVAAHELRHRHLAHVAMLHAAEQVVEHAVAQRAVGDLHRLEAELVEHGAHDRDAAGQHRRAVRPQAGDAVGIGALGLDQQAPQLLQAFARDAFVGEAVLAQDVLDRARGARGADRLLPAGRAIGLARCRRAPGARRARPPSCATCRSVPSAKYFRL